MFYRLVCACVLLMALACKKPEPAKPNVVLMVIDTIRADHMGMYGYGRDTTPNLDAFAKENIKFDYAVSAAPWTPSAVASIFTGLYASEHRMMPPNERKLAMKLSTKLNPNLETLAAAFNRAGYNTTGLSPNPWITKEFNYNKGFEAYSYLDRVNADKINGYGIKALESLNSKDSQGKPWFLYIHYLDPHDPYEPAAPFNTMFNGAPPNVPADFQYNEKMIRNINMYDGEIKFLDQEIGKLFGIMKDRGWYDNTIILIVGDHGEQFLEHGDHTHGFQLHNEELHVPMLLKTAGKTPQSKTVSETVSQIDIYPTLLSLAGISAQSPVDGIVLTDSEALDRRGGVLSEIRRRYDQKAFVDSAGKKIIFNVNFDMETSSWENSDKLWKETPQLLGVYDRNSDYQERSPLQDAALQERLTKQFWDLYNEVSAKSGSTAASQGGDANQDISNDSLEKLKSLGYVQ